MPTLVGIDLSVRAASTGVVMVKTEAMSRPTITFKRDARTTRELQRLINQVVADGGVVAVDVPLGWPRSFLEHIAELPDDPSRFSAAESAPAAGGARSRPFEMLRYRDTDRWLRDRKLRLEDSKGGFVQPKSAASDKLGATTMRWQAIRAGLEDPDTTRVIECYPAAARAMWRSRSAPSTTWLDLEVAVWRRMLQDAFGFEFTTTGRRTPLNSHEKDAYVAAMVASSYVRGRSRCMHASGGARAAHEADAPPPEGCIVLPTDPLEAHPLSPTSARADQ